VSTKIFEGKRFPKTKLGEFVDTVRPAHYAFILEQARHLAAAIKPEVLDKNTWHARTRKITDIFRKVAAESHRTPLLDLECGWRIWWPRGRWAYTVPWGEYLTRHELELPDFVEDYPYWNSTDPPEGMESGAGYRRWRRRAKHWVCACEPRAHLNCLRLVVFEADGMASSIYVDLNEAGMPSVVELLAKLAPRERGSD